MRIGTIKSRSTINGDYRRIPTKETAEGAVYFVGDTAQRKDGWTPVPANLLGEIIWDTRPIIVGLFLHQQKREETHLPRTQEGLENARELLKRQTINGFNYRLVAPLGEYGPDYGLWAEDCALVGVSVPEF